MGHLADAGWSSGTLYHILGARQTTPSRRLTCRAVLLILNSIFVYLVHLREVGHRSSSDTQHPSWHPRRGIYLSNQANTGKSKCDSLPACYGYWIGYQDGTDMCCVGSRLGYTRFYTTFVAPGLRTIYRPVLMPNCTFDKLSSSFDAKLHLWYLICIDVFKYQVRGYNTLLTKWICVCRVV